MRRTGCSTRCARRSRSSSKPSSSSTKCAKAIKPRRGAACRRSRSSDMQTLMVPGFRPSTPLGTALSLSKGRFPVPGWFLMLAFIATASPVSAAVTLRGIVPEDGPRTGWFERYTEARQGPEQVEKFTQSYKVGDGAALDLSHLSGDIRVTGGSGAEIMIEATKRVRNRDPEEAKRLLAALRIEVNNFNGRVEVRTIYPRRGSMGYNFGNNMSVSVDYVISVPADAAVSLKSISGDVSVTAVKGEVRAETVSGDVNVSATPNVAIAKTISGDVTAQNVSTQTTLVLSTISGSVLGTGLKVRALEAGSVSG